MKELQGTDIEGMEGRWLVYAYTPLCGTCQVSKKMLTVVLEIEKVENVGMINVNYFSNYAVKWGVESVPCLLFLNNGEVEDKLYAFQSVPYLLNKVRSYVHVKS
ncbi:MAG: thioredoxin family protein [Bacillaceae bacterium]